MHATATFIVIAAGSLFKLSKFEWISILFAIGFVFSMELLNAAVENISDLVSPEKNTFIQKAKDQAAAAVFFATIVSLVVGAIIFIPKVIHMLNGIR